jgi:hypothetical protein
MWRANRTTIGKKTTGKRLIEKKEREREKRKKKDVEKEQEQRKGI